MMNCGKYLDLDEDDLLELLGAEILGTGPGFGPEDFERQIRFPQGTATTQAA
jgi:hypothetical protein